MLAQIYFDAEHQKSQLTNKTIYNDFNILNNRRLINSAFINIDFIPMENSPAFNYYNHC